MYFMTELCMCMYKNILHNSLLRIGVLWQKRDVEKHSLKLESLKTVGRIWWLKPFSAVCPQHLGIGGMLPVTIKVAFLAFVAY